MATTTWSWILTVLADGREELAAGDHAAPADATADTIRPEILPAVLADLRAGNPGVQYAAGRFTATRTA